MLDVQSLMPGDAAVLPGADVVEAVRALSARELPSLVNRFDT